MKKYKFTIRGHEYNVHLQEIEGDQAKIEVNGTCYEVQLHNEVKKTTKTPKLVRQRVQYKPEDSQIKQVEGGGMKVKAPLPGTIFKLTTSIGQEVKEGDTLLIMEAMKMENNIMAEKAGVIKEIKVKEGDAVLEDDVLVILG